MSIFKKYNIKTLENLSTSQRKLYFPYNKPIQFNKILQKIVIERLNFYINHINNIKKKYDSGNFDYMFYMLDWECIDKDKYHVIIEYCKRCSLEMIYNIIRKNYNYCSIARLDCIILTSFLLSIKILFGHDGVSDNLFTKFKFFLNDIVYKFMINNTSIINKKPDILFKDEYFLSNNKCDLYKQMEIEILINENFNICRKVRLRIGDIV